jgi:hypothetical protein
MLSDVLQARVGDLDVEAASPRTMPVVGVDLAGRMKDQGRRTASGFLVTANLRAASLDDQVEEGVHVAMGGDGEFRRVH